MPTLTYPTINVKYYAIQKVYLRADEASVDQYCIDNDITKVSYTPEQQRFSNDGGLSYQYYGIEVGSTGTTLTWNTVFGYEKVVQELIYS